MVDIIPEREGYTKSSERIARDIMDKRSAKAVEASQSEVFGTQKLRGNGLRVDPFTGEERQSSLFTAQQTEQRTLLSVLTPGKEYGLKGVSTRTMMRSENGSIAGGTQLKRNVETAQTDVRGQMAQIKTDIAQAQKEAIDALKHSAAAADLSPKRVIDSVTPDSPSGKVSAGAMLAGEALTGGGTMATFLKNVVFVGLGLSKQEKQLSPKEQEAIIQDAMERLQTNGTNQVAADTESTVSFDGPKDSEFNWDDITPEEFRELLALDPQDPDLPEYNDLDNDLHFLQDVENHYGSLENHEDVAFVEGGVDFNSGDIDLEDTFGRAVAVDLGSVATTSMALEGISMMRLLGMSPSEVSMSTVEEIAPVFKDAALSQAPAQVYETSFRVPAA